MSGFYDAGPLRRVAINLFNGWGYNFYRRENQIRADDQLIRARACAFLNQARAAIDAAESAYRREHLPPPTRANPLPDPQAVARAQALERLSREIGAVEAQVRSQPVPENDRMTQRRRSEAQGLEQLCESDQDLIGQCDLLLSLAQTLGSDTAPDSGARVSEGIVAIHKTLRRRAELLL